MKCIEEGGQKRLRPVLLTAITTILGLLPMATGMNINFYTLLTELDAQIFLWRRQCYFLGSDGLDCYFWVNLCYIPNLNNCTSNVSSDR